VLKKLKTAGRWWLMPGILATQEAEIRKIEPAWANNSARPSLEKPFTKIGLVEWL
jgi:hypothetical protein